MNLQAIAAIILALYLAVAEYGRSGSVGRVIGLIFMVMAFFILGALWSANVSDQKVSDQLKGKQ